MARSGLRAARISWPAVLVLAVFVLLSLRLLRLVDLHAVNLLFWDQFLLYEAFMGEHGAWDVFRWQHGPHRQGLPFLGTWAIAAWSDWNTRLDAFHVWAWSCGAAGLALWLRRRLFGPLAVGDVAIPLLLLTPAQYGIYVHTPNASHGAGPLLLLVLQAMAWSLESRPRRYACVAVLGFLLVHTGFGVLAGFLTPVLLAIACLHEWRAGGGRALAFALGGLALSLGWIALFFVGYEPQGGFERIAFPAPGLLWYGHYVALMFANLLGVKGQGALPGAVGGAAALAVLGVALAQLRVLLVGDQARRPAAFALLSLTGFTLLYCAGTAVGRMFMGLSGAQSSRYVPLVAPGLLGVVLAIRSLRRPALRRGLAGLAALAMLAASFPMREPEARFMARLSARKRAWIEAYRQSHDLEAANRAARLEIYVRPSPGDRIPEKLEYMRWHRLNLFADP